VQMYSQPYRDICDRKADLQTPMRESAALIPAPRSHETSRRHHRPTVFTHDKTEHSHCAKVRGVSHFRIPLSSPVPTPRSVFRSAMRCRRFWAEPSASQSSSRSRSNRSASRWMSLGDLRITSALAIAFGRPFLSKTNFCSSGRLHS